MTPLSETITIHVAPGTYTGQFGTPSPNSHEKILPIVLNVPNLVLQGSTVLTLDSRGLPTGVAGKAPQTIIQAKDDVKDYQAALVIITRTTDGGSGDNVTVSGLTLTPSRDYSGLMVYRVSVFTISVNYVLRGFQGMWIKMASGSTIGGNYMTDASRATGAFKGVFVAVGSGGLDSPQGMAFGLDGNLYVSSANWFQYSNGPFYPGDFPPGAVLRFQGPNGVSPGTFIDTFVPAGSGGLANPSGLLFGPNGDLFVASCVQNNTLKAKGGMNQVLRFDGTTGAPKGAFVAPGSGGLKSPTFLMFTETDPATLNYNP